MVDASATGSSQNSDPHIAMRDIVRFVRQLSHDVRNHLNAAELQSAFINEIAEEAELKDEIKRLRGMLSEAAAGLQKLSAKIADVKLNPMAYSASDFVDDVRQKIGQEFADANVQWDVEVKDGAMLEIDPQALQQATTELFDNAVRHARGEGAMRATARTDGGEFVLTLEEPKSKFEASTGNWGAEPFRSVSQGHYGLGLHRVRRIIEAHHGQFAADYDARTSSLSTTIRLPLRTSST